MADDIEVRIPEAGGGEVTPDMKLFWDSFKGLLVVARHTLGSQTTISVALSAVTREMRRNFGPEVTAIILRRFADQQDHIMDYDGV
jgi:hypothetical protein